MAGLDTVALRGQLPAMQAIAAAHAECELSRRFGVTWVARADGAGNEIAGITQAQMDAYSSRRDAIHAAVGPAVRAWEEKYGRAPNQRELLHIQQDVTLATRAPKPRSSDLDKDGGAGGLYDWDEMAARWDARLSEPLASIAPAAALRLDPDARCEARGAGAQLPEQALARAALTALAQVQAGHSTWTRADYLKQLGLALPAGTRSMDPAAAVDLLHSLAGRALAGEFEDVVCLEAPEWLAIPDSLRRDLDGRSVYTRPGFERYATRQQLTLEARLLDRAQRQGAPGLSREDVARLLGADLAVLDAQLLARAQDARAVGAGVTGCGLRADQAAALHAALTSPRTAEVLVGPAGSGKTRAAAQAARMWVQAGGAVYGTATSQAARNVLAAGGVELAENTAVFLGHQPGQRGARGIRDLERGTLIIADESSMTSTADLADMCTYAAARGCKLLVLGDSEQLAAVEGGGGMALLAARLGCVQLAEAVRFQAGWEQEASLRLRRGHLSALEEYDDHGRIRGAEPEQVMEDARRLYVTGEDVELIAWERERCREMSRRIRGDLQYLGLVEHGREVALAAGARAGRGDVITARTTDQKAGVANGDALRIEAVNDDGSLTVRARLDRDPQTGQRQWAGATFRYTGYDTADLAYASTAHTAQGRTVTSSITLVTGGETRQWLYSALTRGAESNLACVFITSARLPDPQPGTRPAPELARQEHLAAERAGLPAAEPAREGDPLPREHLAVLADVLRRDGAELSALETQCRNLANADHLARLDAMWRDQVAALEKDRYRQAFRDLLPPGTAAQLEACYCAPWLWRTLRAAEAAGLDAREVAGRAVRERPLEGARDVAAVLDTRIRQATAGLAPAPWKPWTERVPETPDPGQQQFLHELAAAMDARRERIGEHAAQATPQWAVAALGPVPADPADRLDWERRAAHIGAYRELYGWEHPAEPCGPEPAGDSPEKRAAWHAAYTAMTRTEDLDLRGEADGTLHRMRGTYQAETAWAPPHVADRLRAVRGAIIDTAAAAARADAEAATARDRGDHEQARQHQDLAVSARALEGFYRQREAIDAGQMEDYQAWEKVTAGSRADPPSRPATPGRSTGWPQPPCWPPTPPARPSPTPPPSAPPSPR